MLSFYFFIQGLFHVSLCDSWLRALPQESPAGFAWSLTLSGDFQNTVNYQCWFDFHFDSDAESVLSRANVPTFKSAISKPMSPSMLICTIPIFNYAESVGILSVYNSDTATLIPGPSPGSTASLITFTGGWQMMEAVEGTGSCRRCTSDSSLVACNLALGGGRLMITGFGFDPTASDYVCKFICSPDINPACTNGTFVQGAIPTYPSSLFQPSSQTLYCNTPLWPFDAHNFAGRTRVVVEKGGVQLSLFPSQGASPCLDYFDFLEGWDYQSVRGTALATAGSVTLTISGYGFDPAFRNYTCVFSAFPSLRGTPALVVSSLELVCPSPAWDLPVPPGGADVFIYKQSCAGARGSAAACDGGSQVQANGANSAGNLVLVAAVASISPTSSPSTAQLVTLLGGGFDPTRYAYAVLLSDGAVHANFSASPARQAFVCGRAPTHKLCFCVWARVQTHTLAP